MELKIKSDVYDGSKKEITFSTDNLDNFNFIDMYIDEKEYTFELDHLYVIINAFKEYRRLIKEKE